GCACPTTSPPASTAASSSTTRRADSSERSTCGSAEAPMTSDLVPRLLEDYGNRTRVALCEYLRPRAPQRHLYNLVADYPRRGGRMLRPSLCLATARAFGASADEALTSARSEEHTSELQSRSDLVCRLLLEKKKK